jgi:hypothetical protein
MIPRKCPYYETEKCGMYEGLETDKEKGKYAKRHCFKKRYLNCDEYSTQFFEDFFDSVRQADVERVRSFTRAVGAVVLEKIVKRLAKDESR